MGPMRGSSMARAAKQSRASAVFLHVYWPVSVLELYISTHRAPDWSVTHSRSVMLGRA